MLKGNHRFFGSLKFYRNVLAIALPVMLQSLIQTLISLIDNFMVAGLGDVKMSGVNIAGQILFVFMVMMNAICAAGGIFLTQFCGAGDQRGMRQSVCFKTIMLGSMFLIYLLVCTVFRRPILALMVHGNSQADMILDEAQSYMFLMGFVGLPMSISTILASSLRETGKVRLPLIISIAATAVNTFFNWVLIYGNLGAPALEVRGAAYATILARCAELLMYVICFLRKKPDFIPDRETFRKIDLSLFRVILKKGGLLICSEMLWVLTETVTTALYNSRGGADVVSGMSASFSIANLIFVALGGVYTSTGVVIGKLLGKGELEEAKRSKDWLFGGSCIFGIFMCFVGFATIPLIPVVFGRLSEASRTICREMVFSMALLMPIWVVNNMLFAVSRAGGDTKMGARIDAIGALIVLPSMFIMTYFTALGPVAMYIATKCVDIFKDLAAWFGLKKERWVVNLALKNPE